MFTMFHAIAEDLTDLNVYFQKCFKLNTVITEEEAEVQNMLINFLNIM